MQSPLATDDWFTHLYWKGQFVITLTDCVLVDWPDEGGNFVPGTFPKDLVDSLAWYFARIDAEDDLEVANYPDIAEGWTLRAAFGRVHRISLTDVNFERGWIGWREYPPESSAF